MLFFTNEHFRFVFIVTSLLCVLPICIQSEAVKPGGCPQRVLPQHRCIVNQTDECSTDSDCSGDAKCCSTGCAKFCVLPVYTACEQQAQYTLRRGRSLSPDLARQLRMPKCDDSGAFEAIQCDNEAVGSRCWCVDRNGFELAGTRARSLDLVNCSRRHECAALTCRMLCPYRFRLDEAGCPLCQCWDPCQGVICPGQQSCQLEQVPCAREPCPPVPTCKQARSLDSLCSTGRPLTFADGSRPFICGSQPGQPECPTLHECTVPQGAEYGVCCPSIRKVLAPPSQCPQTSSIEERHQCGTPCQFGFQCSSRDICCRSELCGSHCQPKSNLTKCQQKRQQAETLVMREHGGGGYVPQCNADGSFRPRQCSRNGLVCWCVGQDGHNIQGSMAPANQVVCTKTEASVYRGRSLQCEPQRCADVCPFGFQRDAVGCPSCVCAEPCDGFPCPEGSQCHVISDRACRGPICSSRPVCIPSTNSTDNHHITPPEPSAESEYNQEDPHAQDLGVPLGDGDDDDDDDDDNDDDEKEEKNEESIENGDIEKMSTTTDGRAPSNEEYEVDVQSIEDQDQQEYILASGENSVINSSSSDATSPNSHVSSKHVKKTENPQLFLDLEPQSSENVFFSDFHGIDEGSGYSDTSVSESDPATSLKTSKDPVSVDESASISASSSDQMRLLGSASADQATAESVVRSVFALLSREHGRPLVQEASVVRASSQARSLTSHTRTTGRVRPSTQANVLDYSRHLNISGQQNLLAGILPTEKAGQCPFSSPVSGGVCRFDCQSDDSCPGATKCCSTGCGTSCTEAVLATACQHLKSVQEDRARFLGIPAGRTYISQCSDTDGSFEPVQCHPRLGLCWCVDKFGREIARTRTLAPNKVDCQASNAVQCPVLTCATYCEHGRQLDQRGCDTCQCHDPCDQVTCSAGLQCRPVVLRCVTEPCPATPLCLPPLEEPCGSGVQAGPSCGPGLASCAGTHQCHVSPFGEQSFCCPKSRDVCQLPRATGSAAELKSEGCSGNVTIRWYKHHQSGKCLSFNYSDCDNSNSNNFLTEQQCLTVCPELTPCQQRRERQLVSMRRFGHSVYVPECDPVTGHWRSVQCQPEFGQCWCVDPVSGRRIAGSLAKGTTRLRHVCSGKRQSRFTGVARVDDELCDAGQTVHACSRDLCQGRICSGYPQAQCRIDPCDGCRARFYTDSGAEVNCSHGLTTCQLERQELRNTAAWRKLGSHVETDHVSAFVRSSLASLLNQRSEGSVTEVAASPEIWPVTSLLSSGMSVAPPQCGPGGHYLPEQGDGSLSWCVNASGHVQHDSLTRGEVQCGRNGEMVSRHSLGAVCLLSSSSPRVCHDSCAHASCPGHKDALCVADPCNDCAVTFFSLSGVELKCEDPCSQPPSVGMCRGTIPRYYYDRSVGRCSRFYYGGCGGNENNFLTESQCLQRCDKPVDVCVLPPNGNECNDSSSERWYYNVQSGVCEKFKTGRGCDGTNSNSFSSKLQCLSTCPDLVLCPSAPDTIGQPCSRLSACTNAICQQHSETPVDTICRVDSCTCQPYFVDLDGNHVNCTVLDSADRTSSRSINNPQSEQTETSLKVEDTVNSNTADSDQVTADGHKQIDQNQHDDISSVNSASYVDQTTIIGEEVVHLSSVKNRHSNDKKGFSIMNKQSAESDRNDDDSYVSSKSSDGESVEEDVNNGETNDELSHDNIHTGWVTLMNTDPPPSPRTKSIGGYTEIRTSDREEEHRQQSSSSPVIDQLHVRHGSRQARLLTNPNLHASQWAPQTLTAGSQSAPVGASRRHRQLTVPAGAQPEVVAESSVEGGSPSRLAVTASVACASVVVVLAALIIARAVYRRSHQTGSRRKVSSNKESMTNVLSGRSLDEQLAEFGQLSQQTTAPLFRWNY